MLNKMMNLVREEEGQGMAEYALLLGGVAAIVAAALAILGPKINTLITNAF